GGGLVEVVQLELEAELPRDREQVEDAVRGAAGRGDRSDRVLDRLAGEERRRAEVFADELERERARALRRLGLRRVERRDRVQTRRADAEELERQRHRVGGELAAAGAGSRAGDALQLVDVVGAQLAGRV